MSRSEIYLQIVVQWGSDVEADRSRGKKMLEAWGAEVTKRIYPALAHEVDARELRDVKDFLEIALEHR